MTRLIDANVLYEAVEKHWGDRDGFAHFLESLKLIESAPTVRGDNPSQWIPVTERLPEENQWVLTFASSRGWKNYPINVMQFKTCDGPEKFHDWGISSCEATYWMELPNPPTE